jgi:hypothetical protein
VCSIVLVAADERCTGLTALHSASRGHSDFNFTRATDAGFDLSALYVLIILQKPKTCEFAGYRKTRDRDYPLMRYAVPLDRYAARQQVLRLWNAMPKGRLS